MRFSILREPSVYAREERQTLHTDAPFVCRDQLLFLQLVMDGHTAARNMPQTNSDHQVRHAGGNT